VRDHLRIKRTEIERPRHKSGGGSPPKKNNIDHGRGLGDKIEVVIRSFTDSLAVQPPEFNPAFIFKIKIDKGDVSDDDWRKSNLVVLSEEPDGAVVLFSPDQLAEFRNRVATYGGTIPEGQKNPSYAWIASLAEEMELWGRENRIGRKLRNTEIDPNTDYYLDVELWVYGLEDDKRRRIDSLEQFVNNHGGRITDRYVGDNLFLARVKVTGAVLDQMLEIGDIREIDLPPEPAIGIPEYYNSQIDNFPNPLDRPADDSPGICVIDSGVATGHPFLENAIGEVVPFPRSLGSALDQSGHGTMVAGISLFGDVKACIDSLDFTPQVFIYGARVTNAQDRFDDENLIVTQMKEAIQYFKETYDCRVFNISLADPDLVYADGKPSQWASVLDNLAHEYDIVIVISAGNIPVTTFRGPDAETIRANYPAYLLDNASRILEPSTAVNALTVGSLSQYTASVHAGRQPGDLIEPLGELNMPSPFTRSGPGVNGAIKPDVVEYGGSSTWYAMQRRFMDFDAGVDIVSMNWDYRQRLFAARSGTSFSAPKIAHLAALILKKYPGLSANLVRALIANSAKIPDIAQERIANDDDIRRIYGYGLPDPNRALYSTDNRVLLMGEDEIPNDGMHVYEIPIPDEFRSTRGERVITICLAYDPPVRHTRKDYTGVSLEFRLIRGKTTNEIYDWYSNQRVDGVQQIAPRYQCDLRPSLQNRGGGTLHKAEFRIRQNGSLEKYPGEHFHLVIQSKKGWVDNDINPAQRYAVTVTLEHLGVQLDIYNFLQSRIRQDVRQRPQARVRA